MAPPSDTTRRPRGAGSFTQQRQSRGPAIRQPPARHHNRGYATAFHHQACSVSVSTHFDGASHSLFDVLFGAGADRFPDATEDAIVLAAVKDAARR